jgi:hypothetical protein
MPRLDPPDQPTWFTCQTAAYPRSPDGRNWKPAADAAFSPEATSSVMATTTTRTLAITMAHAAVRALRSLG